MEFNQVEKDFFLARLTEVIEANLSNEHFGVSELAREMGMSRSHLHRKVKTITNITISQFLRGIRLKRALELLRESSMNISDVAIESGFGSLSYFTKCFHDYYGVPPSKFGRIEQTEPDHYKAGYPQNKKEKRAIKSARIWITIALLTIISIIFLMLFLGPINFNPIAKKKTIAVLPYNSTDPESKDAFLVDGLMNEIRHKLSQVEDMMVVSRNSVERYRITDKTINEIGKELNVNYILECRAESIHGRTLIELQLHDTENNKDLLSEPFKREISLENIYKVQKEAILAVANDLKAVLEFKEKEQIERIPTDNLAAYNAYMLGNYYLNISIYSPDRRSSNQAIQKARNLFKEAIDLDSTFSDAYASLGLVYINHLYYITRDPDKARNRLETGLSFLEKAFFYDEGNLVALRGKAAYYDRIGLHDDAGELWEQLSKQTEPSYEYFQNEVMRFYGIEDFYATIESYQKYLKSKPEKSLQPPQLLKTMIYVFRVTGYPELEKIMAEQLLEFSRDTIEYLTNMFSSEIYQGDFNAALKYALEARSLGSANSYRNFNVAVGYLWLKDYSNALHYLVVSEDLTKQSGTSVRPSFLSGYIYHMNGYDTKANYHFTEAIKRRQKEIEYDSPTAQQYYSHFYLANIYLALGDEEKAFEYIKILEPPRTIDYGYINLMINWPGFDNIRKRPEFLKVLEHLEDRYQKQHIQIGNLIEDLELNRLLNTAN